MTTIRVKRIRMFIFLAITLILVEVFSHWDVKNPYATLAIDVIVELVKGLFLGAIFTIFVEEEVKK